MSEILTELLGDDPDLNDIARALRALAQAIEDAAQLIENFRTAAAE